MKKLLALMVAMLMVFGLASFAAAEIEMSGDARFRGTMKDNPTHDEDANVDTRYYDNRIRMKINGSNDDGAGVKIQMTMEEQTVWNNDARIAPMYDADDYAYVYVPVADNMTLSAGFMPANWGLKYMSWGSAQSRLKLMIKLDTVTVGVFTQKMVDTHMTPDADGEVDGDFDKNAVLAIANLGDFKVGGIFIMANDARTAVDASGTAINVFFTGKAGDISIMGEVANKSGDLNETADGDSPMGAFVAASMDMDALQVSAAFAMTSSTYKATKYFTPTALIGKAQPTAVADMGDFGDTMAVVLSAGTKLSDEMGVGAKFMYAMWDNYPDDGDGGTLMEVDANFSYALGEVTKLTAVFAYGVPSFDNDAVADDAIMSLGWAINTKF